MTPQYHTLPDGRILTTAALARELGVPRRTLYDAIRKRGLTSVLGRPPKQRAIFQLPDGRQVIQTQLAKELRITDGALCHRRQRGWPLQRVLAAGRQPPQRPRGSKLVWCPTHTMVYTRTLTCGWTWEPMLPGMLDRAREYAQQFGYTLRLVPSACTQCVIPQQRSA